MIVTLINQTASAKSYVSSSVILPANGSVTVGNAFLIQIATDGLLRSDIQNSFVYVSDGTSNFSSSDAIQYLYLIANNAINFGQQLMSNSRPVTIASDQTAIPVIISGTGLSGQAISNYSEITAVANGILSTILTYTVPIGKSLYLNRVEVSGTNISEFTVQFNSSINAKKRTFFGNLNELFDYAMGGNENGYQLVSGTIITITTIHSRPSVGNFNARIQGFQL